MYRKCIDSVLALLRIYDKEHDVVELWEPQETMQEWYELEWTFQGPFLHLEFIYLTTSNKENNITATLFEK